MITPDGETALRFEEPSPGVPTGSATAPNLAAVAERAAARVAAVLKPPAALDPDRPPQLPVAIETVRGAPGDGGIALARAMRYSLTRVGVTVTDNLEDGSLTIQGWVSVSRDDTATDSATVTIAWDVLHPDGSRLGTVTQSNRVGEDQLTGTWGVLPRLVARAGAPGIVQLLDQPEVSQLAQSPRRKTPARPPRQAPIEAPLSLAIQASAKPPAALVEPPLALLARTQPRPHFKSEPEPPEAPSVLVEAPIAVSVTVR